MLKLFAKHNNKTYEIAEDLLEVGFYIYAYDETGKNTHDYLQMDLETAKKCALRQFGVPLDSWTTDKGGH